MAVLTRARRRRAAAPPEGSNMHLRRYSIGLVASLLSLSGLMLAGSGQAGASVVIASHASPTATSTVAKIQQAWSSVPMFSSSPQIARGKVVNSTGVAVSGATVILFPVGAVEHRAGQKLTPLARATTDSSGRFTMRLPMASHKALVTKRSEGALNLHLIAFYPGGLAQWFLPIPAGSKAAAMPSAKLVLRHDSHPAAAVDPAGPNSPASCETDGSPRTVSQIAVIMGYKSSLDTHLAWSQFEYDTTTSVTLGVGISATGPTGGFSASGSTTESAGGAYTWAPLPGAGSNYFEGAGQYVDQEYLCLTAGNYSTYWQLSQKGVAGEFGTPGAPAVSAGQCVPTSPGSTNQIKSSTQETFTSGVQLSADGYGINLSSQAGWNKDTILTYKMGDVGEPMCGVGAEPGDSGSRAVQIHS
jgi:hypothetical protein